MDGGVGTLLQLGAGAILSYKHSVEIKKPSVYEGCDRVLKSIRVIMLSTLLHTYFTLKNLLSKPTCKGNFSKGLQMVPRTQASINLYSMNFKFLDSSIFILYPGYTAKYLNNYNQ